MYYLPISIKEFLAAWMFTLYVKYEILQQEC